jgi:uncharacterized repeat protein (TIGR01451 family)
MRWVGSAGSIITNPDGTYGLFLSGAWSADGDSDAFNQIFYSSSTDGEHWTEPVSVVSTDYSFSASVAQDDSLAGGVDAPLGISAYYSGRAYGPSVVQNPNGTLTMVFAGYRLPKPIETAGTVLGTDASAQYAVGATDPALYRNIMAVTLNSATTPAVATQTTVTSSPTDPVAGQTVTYTATVGVTSPGTGTPTGTVSFSGGSGPLCPAAALSLASPDTATCTTNYAGGAQGDTVTASYGGDSNYAGSSGSTSVSIGSALTLTKATTTPAYGAAGDTLDYTYLVTNDGPDTLSSVVVDDDLIPSVSCPQPSLDAGASETCTGSYTVTQADVDNGSVTNTATAGATDGSVAVGSYTSSVTVDASDATSALSLTTSATGSYRSVGDTISFRYLVTNTGTTTVNSIAVSDDLVPSATCPDPTLAPGVSETCTGSYTVDQADVTAGSVTDAATATGDGPQGGSVSSGTSSVILPESPSFTSASSASGTEGVSFSFTVTTTGGPDRPAITTTSDLPSGVTLTDNGDGTATLAGTPAVGSAGTYPVTLTATDAAGSATQAFTLTVNPEAGFHISTTALPDAVVGTSYSEQLHTSGAGTGTVRWAKIGSLPRGFKLSPSGVLTGTPSPKAVGPFNVEVSASLNRGTPVTATIPLTVDEAPVFDPKAPLATSFDDGTSGTFTVAAAGYPAPTITETGALPSGVTFSAGVLSGTPAVTADTSTYNVSITATNGVGTTATEGFTLTAIAPLVITTTAIPQGSPGASYGPVALGATGGEGTYAWKKTAPLPKGLTLSSSGTLGGALSARLVAGQSYPVEVQVQVKEGKTKVTQTATLSLSVVA